MLWHQRLQPNKQTCGFHVSLLDGDEMLLKLKLLKPGNQLLLAAFVVVATLVWRMWVFWQIDIN